ncbi:hypothetical protein Pcinc_036286 [Petrolisthes cinctipes]|uniref:Uncharacterized protein n=1 Tax=Petrolisthes cinctipes TaxID=88211 RepID=A0AAE1BUS1_PETCI|nr:hypothetical protein Pcinc_036286 [Petrolisthes cinctipes]
MKLIMILTCLAITASKSYGFVGRPFASPVAEFHGPGAGLPPPHIADPGIVSDHREDQGDGNFKYSFETENGIKVEVEGKPGSKGQSNMQGSYSFPLPDGTLVQVTYVADENGYRAETRTI